MKYLTKKRKHEEDKMDLRRKLQATANENALREQYNKRAEQIAREGPKEKPAGYDERRRQRELEKRKSIGPSQRESWKRDIDNMVRSKNSYNSEKTNLDQNSGRSRPRTRTFSEADKKHSRDSSENRGLSRESSETRRSRDSSMKRKPERNRSHSGDSTRDMKRRKRLSSNDGSQAKSSSQLKELEFRARALQSLLNKKEESNKAITRVDRYDR